MASLKVVEENDIRVTVTLEEGEAGGSVWHRLQGVTATERACRGLLQKYTQQEKTKGEKPLQITSCEGASKVKIERLFIREAKPVLHAQL